MRNVFGISPRLATLIVGIIGVLSLAATLWISHLMGTIEFAAGVACTQTCPASIERSCGGAGCDAPDPRACDGSACSSTLSSSRAPADGWERGVPVA